MSGDGSVRFGSSASSSFPHERGWFAQQISYSRPSPMSGDGSVPTSLPLRLSFPHERGWFGSYCCTARKAHFVLPP
jgi:hypothetical protein